MKVEEEENSYKRKKTPKDTEVSPQGVTGKMSEPEWNFVFSIARKTVGQGSWSGKSHSQSTATRPCGKEVDSHNSIHPSVHTLPFIASSSDKLLQRRKHPPPFKKSCRRPYDIHQAVQVSTIRLVGLLIRHYCTNYMTKSLIFTARTRNKSE